MGAKYYFLDNDEYTAQDMNNVLSTLTTQGVSLYKQSGMALMDYEEAIKNLVEPGVEIYNTDACKIVKADDGNYYASAGTCWLPDGSCMVIDDEKLAVENYTAGQLNYVYARHDIPNNRMCIWASIQTISDYVVKLAEIDENGNIYDKRTFAMTKLATPTTSLVYYKSRETLYFSDIERIPNDIVDEPFINSHEGAAATTAYVDIGYPSFRYAMIGYEGLCWRDISDDKTHYCTSPQNGYVYLRKDGQKLKFYYQYHSGSSTRQFQMDIALLVV